MPIRVLIVEDSQIALVILKRILESSPQIEVVGTACSGLEALELIPTTQPDVICTDLHMPYMNGLELTAKVMEFYPCPILVISASVKQEDTHHIFQLLEAGAIDIFPKPDAGLVENDELLKQALIDKINVLSGVRVFKRKQKNATRNLANKPASSPLKFLPKPKIIAIGASTGGPQALYEIFSQLPSGLQVPLICIQHISVGFLQGFIDWLGRNCQLPIRIAQTGETPQPGQIYFSSEQQHLELDSKGRFVHSNTPPLEGNRPSITITFESIAKIYGKSTLGILLTGMGRDGARGLQAIAQAGGWTIAQDEATSVIFGMPHAAIELGAAKQVLPIQAIAPTLLDLFQEQPSNRAHSSFASGVSFAHAARKTRF
jgi:two-component system chemotaxis response regulator CheB